MSFRRGNKSNKVPNVKLRPAPAPAKQARKQSPLVRANDSGFDSEYENSVIDLCPRPFKGIIICATGVNDKTTLFKQAIELGAQSLNDLTDRVTHLIAEEPGSAKYKCALEIGIPIMHPSWISESHDIWLRGDDVDVEESIDAHRLPIFSGVVLSLSGIDDIDRRTRINRLVTQQGGKYLKNLERPIKVTHLLCSNATEEETEKIKYAKKFNERREANIRLVWEEWFWDSLEFGGRFDEEEYLISKPQPQRKVRIAREPASSPPRSSSPLELPGPYGGRASAPRTRQADSLAPNEDEEEIASVKRVPAVTLQIWESLLKPRGFEIMAGKLVRSPSKSKGAIASDRLVETSPTKAKLARVQSESAAVRAQLQGSLISTFRRTHSFAPASKNVSTPHQLFGRAPALPAFSSLHFGSVGSILAEGGDDLPIASSSRASSMLPVQGDEQVGGESAQSKPHSTLFSGLKFRAIGEARCQSVRSVLEGGGGCLVSEEGAEDIDYIIVRLVSGSKLYREEAEEEERAKYRTECWLERCINDERICAPDEHISFTPLKIETPIPGAERIVLSLSGLEESERCWVNRLVRALGITLPPKFSRRSTHLLCPSRNGAKYDKAQEWDIPVVSTEWLAEIATSGVIPSLAVREPEDHMNQEPQGLLDDADALRIDVKGKRKATSFPAVDSGEGEVIKPVDHQQSEMESFGQPDGLLGEPAITRHTTPLLARVATLKDIAAYSSGSRLSFDSDFGRQPTLSEIRQEMVTARIPSSESPSPAKPSSEAPKSSPSPNSPSPAKLQREATRALQETITSLLGKRQPSEEDVAGQQARLGKRARPQSRSKLPIQRETSFTAAPIVVPPARPADQAFDPYPTADGDISMLAAEGPQLDDSLRVVYEDPGQLDEKKRLLELLESQKQEMWEVDNPDSQSSSARKAKGNKGKAPTRRSTRVAGF